MGIYSFMVLIVLIFIVLAALPSKDRRLTWFSRLAKRDRQAFSRLVAACGGNEDLARKMLAHERLLDERATEHQAIMRAVGTIENYRKRGIK